PAEWRDDLPIDLTLALHDEEKPQDGRLNRRADLARLVVERGRHNHDVLSVGVVLRGTGTKSAEEKRGDETGKQKNSENCCGNHTALIRMMKLRVEAID